ncbi:hypothetical protein [Ensifer sp. MJa1]|uniref:hypothetical protein n=1 Tax=Ensifer sp. MJa1 TaxID=2919888 RepID=UPI00300B2419
MKLRLDVLRRYGCGEGPCHNGQDVVFESCDLCLSFDEGRGTALNAGLQPRQRAGNDDASGGNLVGLCENRIEDRAAAFEMLGRVLKTDKRRRVG